MINRVVSYIQDTFRSASDMVNRQEKRVTRSSLVNGVKPETDYDSDSHEELSVKDEAEVSESSSDDSSDSSSDDGDGEDDEDDEEEVDDNDEEHNDAGTSSSIKTPPKKRMRIGKNKKDKLSPRKTRSSQHGDCTDIPSTSGRANLRSRRLPSTMKIEPDTVCGLCLHAAGAGRRGEALLSCARCGNSAHPTCINFSRQKAEKVEQYSWHCTVCKVCEHCGIGKENDQSWLVCEDCDRSYHLECLEHKLRTKPKVWHCHNCAIDHKANAGSNGHGSTMPAKQQTEKAPVEINKCPTPGCDSTGHRTGKHPFHRSVWGCPRASPSHDRKCPTPGCDSKGNISGRSTHHHTQSACPLYNGMSPQHIQRLSDKNSKLTATIKKRKRDSTDSSGAPKSHKVTNEQKEKRKSIQEARRRRPGQHEMTAVEASRAAHREQHDTARQPQLKGLVSDYDLELFELAKQRAQQQLEKEVNDNINCGNIKAVQLGPWEINTWYSAPYPEEYAMLPKIYICQFCLKYMKSPVICRRHAAKCPWRHPPGDEIYRRQTISFWEVDGAKNKMYCQNLCLLAKLFLDHKTLYFDVEPFLFYVMTEADSKGCHIIGYFSKEKNSFLNYNVSCILTLPQYMRKGFGRMLIDFSYLLSKVEGKIGSPEKPLSDLGLVSYRSYWKSVLLDYLHNYQGEEISIKDIAQETAINPYDIVTTFQAMGMLKYWKSKHIVLKREDLIEEHIQKQSRRPPDIKDRIIDGTCLKWKPLNVKENEK